MTQTPEDIKAAEETAKEVALEQNGEDNWDEALNKYPFIKDEKDFIMAGILHERQKMKELQKINDDYVELLDKWEQKNKELQEQNRLQSALINKLQKENENLNGDKFIDKIEINHLQAKCDAYEEALKEAELQIEYMQNKFQATGH